MSNSLIDKQVNYILQKITGLKYEDIYNYYDKQGANPQKIVVVDGKREVIPYNPTKDTFILFGVEEVDTGKESYIVTSGMGGEEGKIVITQKLKVIVEINGKNAQSYALKIKALLWSYDIMSYLEENKISIFTQDPQIQFMNEVVNEEMWERRGFEFEVMVELEYDENPAPEITNASKINVVDLENIKEDKND